MKKILVGFLVIVLLVVGVLSYLGFVPGLSSVFAKQKDLGISADMAQVEAINESIGHIVIVPDSQTQFAGKIMYEGEIPISGSYSSQEVTSVLASWSQNWAITPFYNAQVKIQEDGTAEASGMVKVEKMIQLAKELGYSDSQIDEAASYATFINGDLPVYVVGTLEVTNNQLSIVTSGMQIGNLQVPKSIESQITNVVTDAVQRRMSQVPGLKIDSLTLENGQLNIDGIVPEIERGE